METSNKQTWKYKKHEPGNERLKPTIKLPTQTQDAGKKTQIDHKNSTTENTMKTELTSTGRTGNQLADDLRQNKATNRKEMLETKVNTVTKKDKKTEPTQNKLLGKSKQTNTIKTTSWQTDGVNASVKK